MNTLLSLLLLEKVISFGNLEPKHYIVILVGSCIVFLALVLLVLFYYAMPKIMSLRFRRLFKKETGRAPTKEELNEITNISSEVNAAIGAALHLYFNDMHDYEVTKLTINREVKRQSPWSDKQQVHYQHPVK